MTAYRLVLLNLTIIYSFKFSVVELIDFNRLLQIVSLITGWQMVSPNRRNEIRAHLVCASNTNATYAVMCDTHTVLPYMWRVLDYTCGSRQVLRIAQIIRIS